MTTRFGWLCGVLATLFAACALAAGLQPVPALHARVTDETATLTASERQSLDAKPRSSSARARRSRC